MKVVWASVKQLLRVPSFRATYGINVAVLAAFVGWIFIDAWIWHLLRLIGTYLRIDSLPNGAYEFTWSRFGPRAILFAALALLGILTLFIVFARLFVGRQSGRSLSAWLASVGLLAGWLSFVLRSNSNIGAEYRVRRDLPRFQEVIDGIEANYIHKELKLKSGDLIERALDSTLGGHFYIDEVDPLSVHEAIGLVIWLEGGGYLFLLEGSRYTVEYHPLNLEPSDDKVPPGFKQVYRFGNFVSASKLGDGWFLTRYTWADN